MISCLLALAPLSDTHVSLRVMTYNIRHGRGMDNQLNLERTAEVIRKLNPNLVGLQEVDEKVQRSGSVDQAGFLGDSLTMKPAFGAFMDFQGGRYGMGALSRFPIRRMTSFALPEGNEPRIALIVEVELPTGETLKLVNVHFDWVEDDGFRFAQATKLADELKKAKEPFILLGDFNDEPGSRTLKLFQSIAKEVPKPTSNRFTFSSTKPEKEIDFIFCAPADRWEVASCQVIDEKVASDHRPVFAELTLLPN